jgi:cation diffusion facilitator CzcD-associated flavoprotein CzcO
MLYHLVFFSSWLLVTRYVGSYASGPEILAYLQSVAKKFDLEKYARLHHKVVGAYWDEEEGDWEITVQHELTGATTKDRCHFLINGTGFLK